MSQSHPSPVAMDTSAAAIVTRSFTSRSSRYVVFWCCSVAFDDMGGWVVTPPGRPVDAASHYREDTQSLPPAAG